MKLNTMQKIALKAMAEKVTEWIKDEKNGILIVNGTNEGKKKVNEFLEKHSIPLVVDLEINSDTLIPTIIIRSK